MINDNSNLNKTGLTSSVSSTKSFSIANNGNIFDILSNKIYERPIEAIVREVYSNAIDANIAAKSTGGIKVTLPSSGNPVLIIEDNGIGMSDEKITEVYTQYGNSDKGNDNSQIGGFGIGCKTPFAYTDQITVVSWQNGTKNSYIAIRNDNGPELIRTASVECEPNTSGTIVTVPVMEEDIGEFYRAAVKVFLFAKEFPILNDYDAFLNEAKQYISNLETIEDFLKLREKIANSNLISLNENTIGARLLNVDTNNTVLIEIGGVVYTVSSSTVWNNFYNGYVILHAPVGELSVQASREKLNYDKKTTAKLEEIFNETVKKIIFDVKNMVENKSFSTGDRIKKILEFNIDKLSMLENVA